MFQRLHSCPCIRDVHCKLVLHVLFVAADPPYSLRWSTLKATRHDESLHAKERRTEGWAQMAEMLFKRTIFNASLLPTFYKEQD